MSLAGNKLAGGNPATERVENDFYATDPKAVKAILNSYSFFENADYMSGNQHYFLEPCVGEGHIVKAVNNWCKENCRSLPQFECVDIVNRNYPNTYIADFLQWNTDKKYNGIISNPPYSLAKEFVEKGMELLQENGKMLMFLKLQFLEGAKRKELFEKYPPKYIYVFRNRMPTWKGGQPINPDTGKKWAEVICFAWFVWKKGSKTEPIVRWL